MLKKLLLITTIVFSISLLAQEIVIVGTIYDEYLEPFHGAKIKNSKGKITLSNSEGEFKLKLTIPSELTVSADGFQDEIMNIVSNQGVSLVLKERSLLNQVVMSTTRTSERIFESPVAIERLSRTDVKTGTSLNFYEELANKKGVDVTSNSFDIKTLNTRGFSTLRNPRFVQLIDGADNNYVGSAMPYGNVSGMVDIDVESVELLPGAASALYGANAFNGVVLVNSKSPFDYGGISVDLKSGVTQQKSHQGNMNRGSFYHPSFRAAYQFNENFAAKVVFSHSSGSDWVAEDYRDKKDLESGKLSKGNPNYDGVNVYGDESKVNMKGTGYIKFLLGDILRSDVPKLPNISVSRTGYKESDLRTNDNYKSIKSTFALHYRPTGSDKLELIWTSRFNTSSHILQAPPARYEQKNDQFNTHMIDIKGQDFFVKGYVNYIDGGETNNLGVIGVNVNRSFRSDKEWYSIYMKQLLMGKTPDLARENADVGRPLPGSSLFNKYVIESRSKLLDEGGSGIIDRTHLYNADWNYNLSRHVKFVKIQLGGTFRQMLLGDHEGEGKGALFTDYNGRLKINEWAVYTQISKKILDERLHLLGSFRYDKSQNFDGNISPRLSVMYIAGKDRNHNFRLGFQTAFRNPSTLDQYFGLKVSGNTYLVGNFKENRDSFKENTGIDINRSGFTSASYSKFYQNVFGAANLSDSASVTDVFMKTLSAQKILKTGSFVDTKLKSEELKSFEFGYRGLAYLDNRILELDFTGYINHYTDFITNKELFIPDGGDVNAPYMLPTIKAGDIPGNPFANAVTSIAAKKYKAIIMATNSPAKINSYGFSSSANTKIANNYSLGLSYSFADYSYQKEKYPDFEPSFNMAKHKVKLSFGNVKLFTNFGFKVNARWHSSYLWESPFIDGEVESNTVIDAQFSYSIPSIKSTFKLGATNIGGNSYHTAIGSADVGNVYYVSWMINN